jgi:Domain of unknown function (DUF4129)
MSASTFEKTNWGWQFQQFQQGIGEWLELQLSRNQPNLPNVSVADWVGELIWLVLRVGFWLILGWLLIWLALQILKTLDPYFYSWRLQMSGGANEGGAKLHKAVSLQEWLLRAQQQYHRGNYREAVRALYMAMLQRLNDTGIAPHEASRTDGEYGNITQTLPQQAAYQTLLKTHERLCFGNGEIPKTDYEQCQQAYGKIDKG